MNNYETTIQLAEDLVEGMRSMKILMLQASVASLDELITGQGEPNQQFLDEQYLPIVEELDSWLNW